MSAERVTKPRRKKARKKTRPKAEIISLPKLPEIDPAGCILAAFRGIARREDAERRSALQIHEAREELEWLQSHAADLRAQGMSYQAIADAQSCSKSTAFERVVAWHEELAQRGRTELHRAAISTRYEWMFAKLVAELHLVQSTPLKGMDQVEEAAEALGGIVEDQTQVPATDAPGLTITRRVYLVAAIMRRMTEVVRRHGEVLGVSSGDASTNVNIGPGAGGLFFTQIKVPDDPAGKRRLEEALDAVSRIVGQTGEEPPLLPR